MSFRSLHHELLEYEGKNTFVDVLVPWLENNPEEIEWLKSIRKVSGESIPKMSEDDLWSLYAVSRVTELLALPFQEGRADGSDWPGPLISEDELASFSQSIGLEVIRPEKYSPFHHEIVELTCSPDPAQGPKVTKHHWPCLMLGPLLLMRAGAAVSAGSSIMHPEIAASSTLYWAYRRKNRPHQDLADGWGSNSSWRTDFRRDYHVGDTFHFNVDGEVDLSTLPAETRNEAGLDPDERIELLVNRCFITVPKEHTDQYPYGDRFSMKVN